MVDCRLNLVYLFLMEQQTQDCVTLTPEAVAEVQRMIAAEVKPEGKALRVYVE